MTTSNDATAEFWEIETGKLIQTFTLKPEPSYLSKPSYLGTSKLVSPPILFAEISSDGKLILTENRLWEVATGKLINEFDKYSSPHFSPNSHYLKMLTGSVEKGFSTAIYDLSTLKIKTILPKDSGKIVAWSPDEKIFITDLTNQENSKKQAYIWETETGKKLAELKTHAKYCFDFVSTCISDWDRFSFSLNGKVLMSQSKDEVKFLNPQNGEVIFRLDGAQFPAIWSPNWRFLLSKAKEKGKIILFDVTY